MCLSSLPIFLPNRKDLERKDTNANLFLSYLLNYPCKHNINTFTTLPLLRCDLRPPNPSRFFCTASGELTHGSASGESSSVHYSTAPPQALKSKRFFCHFTMDLDLDDRISIDAGNPVNSPPVTETPTIHVSVDANLEKESIESLAQIDPLTREEAFIFNDNGDFHIENLSSVSKDAGSSLFWEPLDILCDSRTCAGVTDSIPAETISQVDSVIPETMKKGKRQSSEPSPKNEGGRSSERLRRKSKKTIAIVDEFENQGIDDDIINVNEDNNNIDDYKPENESLSGKKGRKSKEKPVRKRKKASEVQVESTKVKKKFPHSTRQNRRQVNPNLLEIPEPELQRCRGGFPMKELIRLAEHRERIAKKEAFTSQTPALNQRCNEAL